MKWTLYALLVLSAGCSTNPIDTTAWEAEHSKAKDANGSLQVVNMNGTSVSIKFKNTSKSTFKVIWDESTMVDFHGNPHRIMHQGVKFLDASSSQPPSVLPAGTEMSDRLSYADGSQYVANLGWMEAPLIVCPNYSCKKEEYYGKFLTLLLTVENSGKKNEYEAKIVLKPKSKSK